MTVRPFGSFSCVKSILIFGALADVPCACNGAATATSSAAQASGLNMVSGVL
jgi:hypothetical protein